MEPNQTPLSPAFEGGRPIPVPVLVALPRHSRMEEVLDYLPPAGWCAEQLPPGTLVRVPLGRRVVTGLVWSRQETEPPPPPSELREIVEVLPELPALGDAWRALLQFAAAYYQRAPGELALAVLPAQMRELDGIQLQRRLRKLARGAVAVLQQGGDVPAKVPGHLVDLPTPPALSPQQLQVLEALARTDAGTFLLHGVTGSGKTEVYLRAAESALERGRQILVLVPEINLTPQLETRFASRFPQHRLVSLHSGLTPPQRLQSWLAAHTGQADLLLGTRMAVFASLPRLGLIVVDEEHDPSYKQQEGARYSARDLAVYRGHLESLPVLLGSATPSLETWLNACPAPEGPARYRRLVMSQRIGEGPLPQVRLLDLERYCAQHGRQALRDQPVAPPLLQALRERVERGEQSLLLLNRRGYAPVLHCSSCGWKSGCPHCSAWRVFHKLDRSLRCHHCGFSERVPLRCPDCGDPDIQPVGRGTERLEEQLTALLPQARIGRIDADTTRMKGSLERQLAAVHEGEVDILIGTQMVAKGHDFRRMTLVAAVNADSALFSSDFRAPERLFALLMQAAGRAGRDATQAGRSEMWVQTWHARHPLFQALQAHDYEAFARSQLQERRAAGLPPYSCLALLRSEARQQSAALGFLWKATQQARTMLPQGVELQLYPPVPASLQRVADVERAQMLIESPHRGVLQRFLAAWLPCLQASNSGETRVLRWAVDVDPQSI